MALLGLCCLLTGSAAQVAGRGPIANSEAPPAPPPSIGWIAVPAEPTPEEPTTTPSSSFALPIPSSQPCPVQPNPLEPCTDAKEIDSEVEIERGTASWYGPGFHGKRTANGERFDMYALTAAHKTLPFGTHLRIRSLRNGSEVDVRVNDRGPFTPGKMIDLSRAAAEAIGLVDLGVKDVVISIVDPTEAASAKALLAQMKPTVLAPHNSRFKPRSKQAVRPAPRGSQKAQQGNAAHHSAAAAVVKKKSR